jgi:hypothetical protein
MRPEILRVTLDSGVLVMLDSDSLAMLDISLSQYGGIDVRAERPGGDGGTEYPQTLFSGRVEVGESVRIGLHNGDSIALRLVSIRNDKANLAVSAPEGYLFHGDGIG